MGIQQKTGLKMKTLIAVLAAMFVLSSLGLGQDTELKSVKGKAAIREYERKTEELAKEYQKKLEDLDKEFRMKSELVNARLITNLNEALTEEARKVNLEEANKINAEIERYKAMPLPKLVETDGAGGEMSKADFLELIEGEWVGRWGGPQYRDGNDGKLRFFTWRITGGKIVRLDGEGKAIENWEKATITYKNGQLFVLNVEGNDKFVYQFVPIRFRGGCLLMLGWGGSRSSFPLTGPPVMVGILEKK